MNLNILQYPDFSYYTELNDGFMISTQGKQIRIVSLEHPKKTLLLDKDSIHGHVSHLEAFEDNSGFLGISDRGETVFYRNPGKTWKISQVFHERGEEYEGPHPILAEDNILIPYFKDKHRTILFRLFQEEGTLRDTFSAIYSPEMKIKAIPALSSYAIEDQKEKYFLHIQGSEIQKIPLPSSTSLSFLGQPFLALDQSFLTIDSEKNKLLLRKYGTSAFLLESTLSFSYPYFLGQLLRLYPGKEKNTYFLLFRYDKERDLYFKIPTEEESLQFLQDVLFSSDKVSPESIQDSFALGYLNLKEPFFSLLYLYSDDKKILNNYKEKYPQIGCKSRLDFLRLFQDMKQELSLKERIPGKVILEAVKEKEEISSSEPLFFIRMDKGTSIQGRYDLTLKQEAKGLCLSLDHPFGKYKEQVKDAVLSPKKDRMVLLGNIASVSFYRIEKDSLILEKILQKNLPGNIYYSPRHLIPLEEGVILYGGKQDGVKKASAYFFTYDGKRLSMMNDGPLVNDQNDLYEPIASSRYLYNGYQLAKWEVKEKKLSLRELTDYQNRYFYPLSIDSHLLYLYRREENNIRIQWIHLEDRTIQETLFPSLLPLGWMVLGGTTKEGNLILLLGEQKYTFPKTEGMLRDAVFDECEIFNNNKEVINFRIYDFNPITTELTELKFPNLIKQKEDAFIFYAIHEQEIILKKDKGTLLILPYEEKKNNG